MILLINLLENLTLNVDLDKTYMVWVFKSRVPRCRLRFGRLRWANVELWHAPLLFHIYVLRFLLLVLLRCELHRILLFVVWFLRFRSTSCLCSQCLFEQVCKAVSCHNIGFWSHTASLGANEFGKQARWYLGGLLITETDILRLRTSENRWVFIVIAGNVIS